MKTLTKTLIPVCSIPLALAPMCLTNCGKASFVIKEHVFAIGGVAKPLDVKVHSEDTMTEQQGWDMYFNDINKDPEIFANDFMIKFANGRVEGARDASMKIDVKEFNFEKKYISFSFSYYSLLLLQNNAGSELETNISFTFKKVPYVYWYGPFLGWYDNWFFGPTDDLNVLKNNKKWSYEYHEKMVGRERGEEIVLTDFNTAANYKTSDEDWAIILNKNSTGFVWYTGYMVVTYLRDIHCSDK